MGKAALDGPGWTPGPLASATFFCHRPPLAIPGNSGSFPGQSEYAVEVARTWKFKPARGDFSPRSGKGGASAPPQQDIPSYPRVSRPEQFVRSSGSGRETKRELAAASSAGLKPRPSDRPMKATKCGEKSGLKPRLDSTSESPQIGTLPWREALLGQAAQNHILNAMRLAEHPLFSLVSVFVHGVQVWS